MHLYIIRHAESANNALYATTGGSDGRQPDPPLTERGHQQAQRLARFLAAPGAADPGRYAERHDRAGFRLTHLYTSLMIRAITTGGYIAQATGLPLQAWPEIHERGGLHSVDPETGAEIGVPGPGRAFFAAEYPHLRLPDTLGEAGWWSRERETEAEFTPRARVVWRQLLARHRDSNDRVALVTHGGFFHSFLSALLSPDELPPPAHLDAARLWFSMSNAAISRIDFVEGIIVIRYLNRVDYLPDDLLSG